jgi:hypothetical protein
MTPCLARCNIFVAVVLVVLGAVGTDARAQAWVGDRGTLDISLDYNFAHSDKIVGDKDIEFPNAGTTTTASWGCILTSVAGATTMARPMRR